MVGDNQQSLKKGRRVEAVVRYVGQNEVKCSLPELGGLDALLSATDISSRGPVTPSDFLKAGQSINARYTLIPSCHNPAPAVFSGEGFMAWCAVLRCCRHARGSALTPSNST